MAQFTRQTSGMNGSEADQENESPILSVEKSLSRDDKDEQIIQLQRKLKALKDAFIKERDAKTESEKQLAEHKRKLNSYEVSLIDKDNQILKLQGENSGLQDQVMSLRKKAENLQGSITLKASTSGSEGENNFSSLGSTLSSSIVEMFGGKKGNTDELKKLQTEYNYLRKQFDTVKQRLITVDEVKQELTKEVETLRENLTTAETNYARAADELVKKAKDAENFEKLFAAISQAHNSLKEQFTAQDNELKTLKNRHEAIVKEKDNYKTSFEDMSKVLEEKNHILEQLEAQTRILNEKKYALDQMLQERDAYIKELESNYQAFPATRKAAQDTPALLLLRKDVEGDFVLDIETSEDRKLLLPYQIASVSPNKENQNVFTITYRVKPNKSEEETFETPESIKLLKSLKKFLENAREKSKNEQNVSSLKKDSAQKKEKKFFAEVASFFSS